MSELPEKCCGRCCEWSPYFGRTTNSPTMGECGWRPAIAVANSYVLTMMFDDDGTDCPCFEAKEPTCPS